MLADGVHLLEGGVHMLAGGNHMLGVGGHMLTSACQIMAGGHILASDRH